MSGDVSRGALFLGGGGDREDSLPMDRRLAELVPPGRPILYLPLALDPRHSPYAAAHTWARSVFNPLGIDDVVMWDSLQGKTLADLQPFAAVYLPGGNTYRLLDQIRAAGFDAALVAFAENGGILSGGSAGAIILGRSIDTAGYLGDPNYVGLQNTDGLDLLAGASVWPHYVASHAETIHRFVAACRYPLIALSERAGAIVQGTTVEAVGYDPVYLFHPDGSIVVPLGSSHSMVDGAVFGRPPAG